MYRVKLPTGSIINLDDITEAMPLATQDAPRLLVRWQGLQQTSVFTGADATAIYGELERMSGAIGRRAVITPSADGELQENMRDA